MPFLVIDSEATVPRAVTFLGPYPLSGFNPPINAAAAPPPAGVAVESYPLSEKAGGNVDSPYENSLSYSNEVSNVHTNGGVVVSPTNPPQVFADDEPYGQGMGAVGPITQPYAIAGSG
jgi:hypothetical protein